MTDALARAFEGRTIIPACAAAKALGMDEKTLRNCARVGAVQREDNGKYTEEALRAFLRGEGNEAWNYRIYFIHAADTGLVKVGRTNNVNARLAALRTMSPTPLTLLATECGRAPEERKLHARFAADRAHGEWFRYSAELQAYVAKLTGKGRRRG